MKYKTIYLMVRVMVHADHAHVSDTVKELENQSTLLLTDTANINVLETEILVSRINNPRIHRAKHAENRPSISAHDNRS